MTSFRELIRARRRRQACRDWTRLAVLESRRSELLQGDPFTTEALGRLRLGSRREISDFGMSGEFWNLDPSRTARLAALLKVRLHQSPLTFSGLVRGTLLFGDHTLTCFGTRGPSAHLRFQLDGQRIGVMRADRWIRRIEILPVRGNRLVAETHVRVLESNPTDFRPLEFLDPLDPTVRVRAIGRPCATRQPVAFVRHNDPDPAKGWLQDNRAIFPEPETLAPMDRETRALILAGTLFMPVVLQRGGG